FLPASRPTTATYTLSLHDALPIYGGGEMLTCLLRPDNAGSNTAAGHKDQTGADPGGDGSSAGEEGADPDRRCRVDQGDHRGAGETPSVVIGGLHPARQHPGALPDHPRATPAPAYGPDGTPRQGADVAELTGLLDLGESPEGMRVIVRCERPRPGAQLRSEDVDGYRLTAFAANTTRGQLADLEVRH